MKGGEVEGVEPSTPMTPPPLARRLRRLPVAIARGRRVRVAVGLRARLLGLALLDRGRVGGGLLIPRCGSVHTFGMRFALDVVFLDEEGRQLAVRRGVPPRRFARDRRAASVLELPAAGASASLVAGKCGSEGGEFSSLDP
jgi:uncharacterized membrane protein (UPF0127 family)